MPAARKLKVYRTPIGFHDAYVAAPSQKAALTAWGSDADLFARGAAEQVEDPALMAEPLAHPGEVVRKLRATAEEQLAAIHPDSPSGRMQPRPRRAVAKPSRAALDAAERAKAALETDHRRQMSKIEKREHDLARDRQGLESRHRKERERLGARIEQARSDYEDAMRKWRE